jgi:putative ABC transport system permease protein
MTATLDRPSTRVLPPNGGLPARRAVVRWAWRLFWREWRQQFLILALITLAVAATIVGSAVAMNNPSPTDAGFGTARYSASFSTYNAQAAGIIARLDRVDPVDVIENKTLTIPGTIDTYQLRAQNPHGPFGGPMLSLVSGRYPSGADEVAVTSGVASAFHLSQGDTWRVGGVERQVVGIVENPQSLLDEFALVAPGQVTDPTGVTVLFDQPGAALSSFKGVQIETPASVAQSNPLNPETISLTALALGMLLIALVSIGGFTVLAQRRMRSIGMLESIGATDRHVSLVVSANGTIVGALGAILGFIIGLIAWLLYRPRLEQSSHHLFGALALPWAVIIAAMVLAVVAALFAASRPARAITKVPIVQALSGRPAPPRQIHRSALPGIIFLVAAFLLLGYSGGTNNGNGSGGSPELLLGIILLIPGLILFAPFFLSLAARLGRHAPIAARLALRDLARYRARSGSALAAISIGVLVAVIVILAAAARYGNVLDYAGPNLSSNELALHANVPPPAGTQIQSPNGTIHTQGAESSALAATLRQAPAHAEAIARGLGARLVALETPNANLNATEGGRNWDGQIYVATPQLLQAFGIPASDINPNADILTSRPGLSSVSGMTFTYGSSSGNGPQKGGSGPPSSSQCDAASDCLANPAVQEIGALPTGTSAPNTVITEHAMREFRIGSATNDWLVQGSQPFTAAQISSAELAASTTQISVESKNDQPTSSAVVGWATIFGIIVALGVLGMSVGLVRSETANDLRTLTAAGASSYTRRTLTAVTAGALGFSGALLGVVGGYIGMIGWLRSNSLNGGVSALGNVPVADLLLILLGMPAFASIVGWLFAGRQPSALAHQAID